MKIYYSTAIWAHEQEDFLRQCLTKWEAMPHEVHAHVDCTVNLDFTDFKTPVTQYLNPYEEHKKYTQTWHHRARMMTVLDDYDLFVYAEDDILITEENINYYLIETERLPPDKIISFIRVQEDAGSIDCVEWKANEAIRGKEYFTLNLGHYSACFMLNQQQMKTAFKNGLPLKRDKDTPYGVPEQAAWGPYWLKCWTPVVAWDGLLDTVDAPCTVVHLKKDSGGSAVYKRLIPSAPSQYTTPPSSPYSQCETPEPQTQADA